jgi:hypothetical protein
VSASLPATFIDEYGDEHDWDDPAPPCDCDTLPDPDCPYCGEAAEVDAAPYTYRDLVADVAEARGMDMDEYVDHLGLLRGEVEDMEPEWMTDEY